jgi:hypothetical protein
VFFFFFDQKMAKDEKKAAPKPDPKAAEKERKPRKVTNFTTPKGEKKVGRTAAQEERKQKRLRNPKIWDFINKKRKLPKAQIKNFHKTPRNLEDHKDFTKTLRRRHQTWGERSRRKPVIFHAGVTPRKFGFKHPLAKIIYTKPERKTKATWSFKQYRTLFGVYATKANLVKYFKANADAAKFVDRNFKKNMNLSHLVQQGRNRLKKHALHQAKTAPAVIRTAASLKDLKANKEYAAFIEKLLGAKVDAVDATTQSYVVQIIRSGVADDGLAERVHAFAK